MAPLKASLLRFVFNKASIPLADNVGLPRDNVNGGEDDDSLNLLTIIHSGHPFHDVLRCVKTSFSYLKVHNCIATKLSPIDEIPKWKKHLDRTNVNWKATDNRRTTMNHHPRWKDLYSTAQLLREAASSFSANIIITFLFLSLLILSFCTIIENDTTHVTSFIYRDPSLKALLSRLDLANNTNSNRFRSPKDPLPAAFRHHCHIPFLHLTRDRTLDGDFFSSDDDDGRFLFRRNEKSSVNGGFVFFGSFNLKSGFLDIVIEIGLGFGM